MSFSFTSLTLSLSSHTFERGRILEKEKSDFRFILLVFFTLTQSHCVRLSEKKISSLLTFHAYLASFNSLKIKMNVICLQDNELVLFTYTRIAPLISFLFNLSMFSQCINSLLFKMRHDITSGDEQLSINSPLS